MNMKQGKLWSGLVLIVVGLVSNGSVVAQPSSPVIDSPYEAAEAGSVKLVFGSDNKVIRIVGEGCPTCPSHSFLPSREFSVFMRGEKLTGNEMSRLNGIPGAIHYDKSSGLARQVTFAPIVTERGVK